MEAEAHDCLRQLGRGRRRTNRFDRMGRAARIGSRECAGILQHGCSRFRREVRRFIGSSLKQFLRDVTKVVPSPKGGMLYDEWRKANQPGAENAQAPTEAIGDTGRLPAAQGKSDVPVGDLGSGSDYTVFLQHLGVPSTDVSSTGSYGVYHSVFDNFAW